MFAEADQQYLMRHLGRAGLVLFLGAGSSRDATNRLGERLPSGHGLAKEIWNVLGYDGDYDDTPLPQMYDALLSSGKPYQEIRNFLEDNLLCSHVPTEYSALTRPFWYRIYTTNCDDLVKLAYREVRRPRLAVLTYPHDDPAERDQSLATIQLIHLHGRLPCQPDEITFSLEQYGRSAARPQPLYAQFVRDYATRPVLFVGTKLDEQLLWQYVESRESRAPGVSEQRPKSFLVAPSVSPPKRQHLERYNIKAVEGDMRSLLDWLSGIASDLPDHKETLRITMPSLASLSSSPSTSSAHAKVTTAFAGSFTLVPTDRAKRDQRSFYLLGASPHWEDLFANLDAPRTVTSELVEYVTQQLSPDRPLTVSAILGSAGCGKSTILRRLGIHLAQAGRLVFLTNSESLPAPYLVRRYLDSLPEKAVLLFDNAEIALGAIPTLAKELRSCTHPPALVVASRTNDFDRIWSRGSAKLTIKEIEVPKSLDRSEIQNIISILEQHGLLGQLQGMTPPQRIQEFEGKASKQILVAMREATSGDGFNTIIKGEFESLVPNESKHLYLCAALATDAGYRLSKPEFVACARVPPSEALHLLARNLRDVVVSSGPGDDLLLLRHRLIAEHVIGHVVERTQLRIAYVSLLRALAPVVKGRQFRSRVFGLYRSLINHQQLYRRFENEIDEARAIYEALKSSFRSEAQFWLQYGSLELEGDGGELSLAENYLGQARSLDAGNAYILNTWGHLRLRQSREASNRGEAETLLREGSTILEERMAETQYQDAYAVHIYCSQRLRWARVWHYNDPSAMTDELQHLRQTIQEGVRSSPRRRRLKQLRDVIVRQDLMRVVRSDESDVLVLPPPDEKD